MGSGVVWKELGKAPVYKEAIMDLPGTARWTVWGFMEHKIREEARSRDLRGIREGTHDCCVGPMC